MKDTLPVAKIFVAGLVISSLLIFPFLLDLTLVPRFLSFSICLTLSIYFVYTSQRTTKVQLDSILIFYLSYTLICCLSFFWAKNRSESLFDLSKQVLYLFAFLFTYFLLKHNKDFFIDAILRSAVVLSVISLLAGFYQFAGVETQYKDSLYEVTGLYGHKNLFSSFLFLNLFFLLTATFKLPSPWKRGAVICIALDLAAILLLKTKAVIVALAVALLVLTVVYIYRRINAKIKFRPWLFLLICMVLANLLFFYFLRPIVHSGTGYASKSNSATLKLEEERLVLWDKTYHMVEQRPVLGVGCGNWQIYFPDATLNGLWRAEDLNYTFQRPHNDFLWIASETGILGLNLYFLFLFSIMIWLVRTLKLAGDNKILVRETALCLAFIAGYCVISFFDFPKERIEHGIWFNVLLGLAYYSIKEVNPIKSFKTTGISKPVYIICLAGMLGVVWLGFLRCRGEFNTKRMYDAKNKGELDEVIKRAEAGFSWAYSIDPTSVPLLWYTGNAYAKLGDYTSAQKDFIRAYELNPYNRNVLNDLASSYVFSGNPTLAKKYYEEAARISPRFDDPKLNLAALYIQEKNYKMASHWLSTILHDSERRKNYQAIVNLQK
jgi:O-antigen ligase